MEALVGGKGLVQDCDEELLREAGRVAVGHDGGCEKRLRPSLYWAIVVVVVVSGDENDLEIKTNVYRAYIECLLIGNTYGG